MRLGRVENGHNLRERLKLRMMSRTMGYEPTDIIKLCLYRPEFFGTPYSDLAQDIMRGPSDWSIGERELFAVFVSRQNQCPFCAGAHGAAASHVLGDDVTQAVLADWQTAPVDEKLRATFGLLQKMTLSPGEVRPEDVQLLRVAGVSDEAITDALYVCALFNLVDRIADALGFHVPSQEYFAHHAPALLQCGYLENARDRT